MASGTAAKMKNGVPMQLTMTAAIVAKEQRRKASHVPGSF